MSVLEDIRSLRLSWLKRPFLFCSSADLCNLKKELPLLEIILKVSCFRSYCISFSDSHCHFWGHLTCTFYERNEKVEVSFFAVFLYILLLKVLNVTRMYIIPFSEYQKPFIFKEKYTISHLAKIKIERLIPWKPAPTQGTCAAFRRTTLHSGPNCTTRETEVKYL